MWYIFTSISLFSRIKEKSLRPLFHNLKQVNDLFLFPFHFFQSISIQVAQAVFQEILTIGISDISCKTTLNRHYSFIKIISRKTQTTHNIILSWLVVVNGLVWDHLLSLKVKKLSFLCTFFYVRFLVKKEIRVASDDVNMSQLN